MPIRDYSYIDENRINAYANQISSDPIRKKGLNWTVGLKLSGPELGAAQSNSERQRTLHEKIELIIANLGKTKELESGRISAGEHFQKSERVFRWEDSFAALPLLVPVTDQPPLALWLSDQDELARPNRLLLIADNRNSDRFGYGAFSGYGTLRAIADQGFPLADFMRTAEESKAGAPRFDNAFNGDLVGVFRGLGATVGAAKRIQTLYRIRHVHMISHENTMTIAYPLFVASNPL